MKRDEREVIQRWRAKSSAASKASSQDWAPEGRTESHRIFGFPSNAFRQIGNAVPPLLGAAVGRQFITALRSQKRREPRLSSLALGEALADWMMTQKENELAQPWRGSKDLWHTLIGMILFEKAKPLVARNFWWTYARRWATPRDYLEDPRREAATRAIGRAGASELLELIARALTGGEDRLLSGDEKVPRLSRERLLYTATLCGSAQSFQPTGQTTRIARRDFDGDIRDSRIEQQLALVRLIDVDLVTLYGSGLRGVLYSHSSSKPKRPEPVE